MAARLQRYEELLRRHGIKLDELDDPVISARPGIASASVDGANSSHISAVVGKDGLPLYAPKYVIFSLPSILARNLSGRRSIHTNPDSA